MSPSQLRRATDYLNSHLEQNLSLSKVAAVVGVSMHHFARAFKQSTGIPPHRYLMERRVERAKLLLSQTNLPLPEITFRLGFSSQSHFTTVFRQTMGSSYDLRTGKKSEARILQTTVWCASRDFYLHGGDGQSI